MDKEPHWINAFDRTPTRHGLYFAKVDGRKEMLRWYEFDRAKEMYGTVLWLEEFEDRVAPVTKKSSFFDSYVFLKDVEPEPVKKVQIRMSPVVAPVEKLAEPLPTLSETVEHIIKNWDTVARDMPATPAPKRTRIHIVPRADKGKKHKPYRWKTRNVKSKPENISLLGYEFEIFDDVYKGNYRPNENDLNYSTKLRIRENLIRIYSIHENDRKDFIPNTDISTCFNLCQIRKVFPRLYLRPEIPEEMLPELRWVYGISGVSFIGKKLLMSYKVIQTRLKNKKDGTKKASKPSTDSTPNEG